MSREKIIFISIDGHGGSGKSILAHQLAQYMHAGIIQIDDFTGMGATTDWYKSLIHEVIDPALNGAQTISYSRAKWWPEHDPEPAVNQPVTPIMIIEGVCSSRQELRKYMSLKVFVNTPRDICIERGLARDKGMGGKSDVEIIAQWNQWLRWDDEYFAKDNPESIADIIVDGMKPYDEVLKSIGLKMRQIR